MSREISVDVLSVLRASDLQGDKIVLPGSLDRSLYTKVNKVLELFGAKWNRKQQAHLLQHPELANELRSAIGTGATERSKTVEQELGFFQTSEAIAKEICREVHLAGAYVLEPNAGHGRLIDAALEFSPSHVVGIELYEANAAVLGRKYEQKPDVTIHSGDFLDMNTDMIGLFDVILMNPPFASGQDVTHVLHALSFLAHGGTLKAIMSAGVATNTQRKYEDFRNRISSLNGSWRRLPENSFKESGTNVSTILLTVYA